MSGGQYGVHLGGSDSENVTIRNSKIENYATRGVSADRGNRGLVVQDNEILGSGSGTYGLYTLSDAPEIIGNNIFNHQYGIWTDTYINGYTGGHIADNDVWRTTTYGMYVRGYFFQPEPILVENNRVFDGNTGILVTEDVDIIGNQVFENTTGISTSNNRTLLEDNEVFRNTTGIRAIDGPVLNNKVYANTSVGIISRSNSLISGNEVYSNSVGIQLGDGTRDYTGLVTNNFIFDNTNIGIRSIEANSSNVAEIYNNTIVQSSGDLIRLEDTIGMIIRNNILSTESGSLLDVGATAQQGLSVDYNLLDIGTSGEIANWAGRSITSRADWLYELGLGAHSIEATPDFVDVLGPDGILGYEGSTDATLSTLDYREFDGFFSSVDEFINRTDPISTGQTSELDPLIATSSSFYGLDFTGQITIPQTGIWTFDLTSDDGSVLWINGQEIVDNDGRHGTQTRQGTIDLTAGVYDIRVAYFSYTGSRTLTLNWEGPGVDGALDNDFHLAPTSIGIDRGHPGFLYFNEPTPNGARINLGAFGNTPEASSRIGAAQQVQIFSPNGLEKIAIGEETEIDWLATGLAQEELTLSLNVGGSSSGDWISNRYQTAGRSGAFNYTVDISDFVYEIPTAVLQSAAYDDGLQYNLPLPDGDYSLRVYAYENSTSVGTNRRMDIQVNGQVAAAGFSAYESAGNANFKLTAIDIPATASNGEGIELSFHQVGSFAPQVMGLEAFIVDPANATIPTFGLDYSLDGGATWSPITTGLTVDRYNRGSYLWTTPAGSNQALVRVTSEQVPAVSDTSDETFSIDGLVGAGAYYVNLATDTDFSDNEYTTAAGDNANSGRSPDAPMASLPALLSVYDLGPGDIIYVEAGQYDLFGNLLITNNDAGVTLRGATNHQTILNRGNGSTGNYTIELRDADAVTIEHFTITGGSYGIHVDGADNEDVVIRNNRIVDNTQRGVSSDRGNRGMVVQDNDIFSNGTGGYGIYSLSDEPEIIGNRVSNHQYGVWADAYVNGHTGGRIIDNDVQTATTYGIYARGYFFQPEPFLVQNNRVSDSTTGILAAEDTDVIGNQVFENTTGISISNNRTLVQANEVFRNTTGIRAWDGPVIENEVYGNTSVGIHTRFNSLISGNRVHSNPVGIRLGDGSRDYTGTVRYNVIYENTSVGIDSIEANSTNTAEIHNNTIVQSSGDLIRLLDTTGIVIRNNILSTESGSLYDVSANSQQDLVIDYNVLDTGTSGEIANWDGRSVVGRANWLYELGYGANSIEATPGFVDPLGPDGQVGYQRSQSEATLSAFDYRVFDGNFTSVDEFINRTDPRGTGQTETLTTGVAGSNSYFGLDFTGEVTLPESGLWTVTLSSNDGSALWVNGQRVIDNASNGTQTRQATLDLSAGVHDIRIAHYQLTSSHSLSITWESPGVNGGFDNDYHLTPASIGIDRGHPGYLFFDEPAPNGGRINIGAYGGTNEATSRPNSSQQVQITSPNGLEKIAIGQETEINWKATGLAQQELSLQLNVGGSGAGSWLSNRYQVAGRSGTFNYTVDTSDFAYEIPDTVLRSAAYDDGLQYNLPLPDGDYTLRVYAYENATFVGTSRRMDIQVNGEVVESGFSAYEAAGNTYLKLAAIDIPATASNGEGVQLSFHQTGTQSPQIMGLEAFIADPTNPLAPTFSLDYSLDGGSTWAPIASGLTIDRNSQGSYLWTTPASSSQAMVRVTSEQVPTVNDASDEIFTIDGLSGAGAYYVNIAGDADFTDNEYTTAAGDNNNSGRTADSPMASLAALLNVYDLGAGDIVYVDSGQYDLFGNLLITNDDAGVTLRGATNHETILNRGNGNNGNYAIEIRDANEVTIEQFTIIGANYGIHLDGEGSEDVVIRNNKIHSHAVRGISSDRGNRGLWIEGNEIYDNGSNGYGIYSFAEEPTVVDNILRNNRFGAYIDTNLSTYVGGRIAENEAYDNVNYGIQTRAYFSQAIPLLVENNEVFDNGNTGIYTGGRTEVLSNTIYSNPTGVFSPDDDGIIRNNDILLNNIGIDTRGTATLDNNVYANTTYGIRAIFHTFVSGNHVYSNPTGIVLGDTSRSNYTYSGLTSNNLLYANTENGIWMINAGSSPELVNNTIYQIAGDAIRLEEASDLRVYNNAIWVEAGFGFRINTSAFSEIISDYNMFTIGDDPNANVGFYQSTPIRTIDEWHTTTSFDANSLEGEPLFADVNGADNLFGFVTEQGGVDGGDDDNFFLTLGSDAIDRGSTWDGIDSDIDGVPRIDDNGVANAGGPAYFFNETTTNIFDEPLSGDPQNWRTTSGIWELNFPARL